MIQIDPTQTDQLQTLAALVGPEDIRAGDYLASMNDVDQFAMRACESDAIPGAGPKVTFVTARSVTCFPRVLRVLAVGLPFVLVEDERGEKQLVTVRLHEFARLPPELGRVAMRELDRRRKRERAKRREEAAKRREARDRPGTPGAEGAD